MTYAQQLRDKRWKRCAKAIRHRDNYRCVICSNHDCPLHVHHIIYLPERLAWEYPDKLMITLCEECHEGRHEITKKLTDALLIKLARVPTERLEKIAHQVMAAAMEELPDDG